MRVTVVLPTYNERDTLPVLLRRFRDVASGWHLDCETVVVDDSSPDGTAEEATRVGEELRGALSVTVVTRPGKAGLASAVLEGIKRGRGDVIVVMDADLSHPPEAVPGLLSAIAAGADVAVASRYTAGGGVERWPLWRRVLSWGATWLARTLLRVPVRDPMSGFFAARRSVFQGMRFEGAGYKLLLEILARRTGIKVSEVPYRFTDRAGGHSKLNFGEVLTTARLLQRLWLER